MDIYESFKNQILSGGLGELRGRERKEFFVKVAKHAYENEKEKLAYYSMKPMVDALVKTAILHRACKVMSLDENKSPKTEEKR